MARRQVARAFTLLEILISTVILAILVLATASLLITLQKANTTVAHKTDIQMNGQRVLDVLRREVRQSGFESANDTEQIATPTVGNTTNSLIFKKRTSFDGATPEVDDWTGNVEYIREVDDPGTFQGVSGSITRYRLIRREDTDKNGTAGEAGEPSLVIARNLSEVSFQRLDDYTLEVRLVFMRADPDWTSGGPPPPIRTRFVEKIKMQNRK